MTAEPHPFIIAAQDLFARRSWSYKLIEGGLRSRSNKPLGFELLLAVDDSSLAAIGRLDATVTERNVGEALLAVNEYNQRFYSPQAYLDASDGELHPYCATSMPITLFNADRATETVAEFLDSIGLWVQWWAQHPDSLERRPIERWWASGVRSPWADILVQAGFLPEDADGIDDVEAFASELLVEYCAATVQPRDT